MEGVEEYTHGNKGIVRVHGYAVTSRDDGVGSARTPLNNAIRQMDQGAPSVTWCHQVALSGSLGPQPAMFAPYASRVLYSYSYVGPNWICESSSENACKIQSRDCHSLGRKQIFDKVWRVVNRNENFSVGI